MVLEEESSLRELRCWVKVGDRAFLYCVRLGGVLSKKRVLSHEENQRKGGGDSVSDAVKPDL